MVQNQTSDAVPNVLHDQGVPNALRGIGGPIATARPRPASRMIVFAATVLLAMIAIIASRAT